MVVQLVVKQLANEVGSAWPGAVLQALLLAAKNGGEVSTVVVVEYFTPSWSILIFSFASCDIA